MNRGDRIEAPLLRRGSELHATDWDEAFDVVASRLRGAGGKAVALVSPKVSTEALYFARRAVPRARVERRLPGGHG